MPGTAALTTKPGELDKDAADYWARLATSTGYSITTVQKAEQVLVARGWLVRIRTGKNWLTRAERLELDAAGSRARQRRNVWACTQPQHTRRASPPAAPVDDVVDHLVDNSPSRRGADAGCDLPTTQRVSGSVSVPANKIFKPERASRTAPAGRPPTGAGPRKRPYQADQRTVRLAKDLRARISWLRPVPHQRIMPPLPRFAAADWTASDVQNALDSLLAPRGWRVPDARTPHGPDGAARSYPMRSPWAYLAMLLRGLEPTDLISRRDHERELADYQALLRTGPECPHGQRGGDIPSPAKSILACPLCRRACSAAS